MYFRVGVRNVVRTLELKARVTEGKERLQYFIHRDQEVF